MRESTFPTGTEAPSTQAQTPDLCPSLVACDVATNVHTVHGWHVPREDQLLNDNEPSRASTNQSINQSTIQSICKSINQPITHPQAGATSPCTCIWPTDDTYSRKTRASKVTSWQPINQPINRPPNQSINQPSSQPALLSAFSQPPSALSRLSLSPHSQPSGQLSSGLPSALSQLSPGPLSTPQLLPVTDEL